MPIFLLFLLGVFFIPFSNIKPIIILNISDICFLLSLFLIIITFLINKNKFYKGNYYLPFIVASVLILFGGVLSSVFRSKNGFSSIKEVFEIIFVFGVFQLIVLFTAKSIKKISIILDFLLIGIVFSSIIAIIDYHFGTQIGPSFAWNAKYELFYGNAGRYAGVTAHPNFQGYYTSMALPVIVGCIGYKRSSIIRNLLYYFAFIVCCYGLVLTGSISSLVSSILGLALYFVALILKMKKIRLVSTIIVILLLASVLILIFTNNIQNTSEIVLRSISTNRNISRVINSTFLSRTIASEYTFREISNNPFIGVGFDKESIDDVSPVDRQGNPSSVHNAILRAFLQGGILTFVGYLIIYFYCIKLIFFSLNNFLSPSANSILLGLAGSITSFVIMDTAQPTTHVRISWLVFFLAVSLKQTILFNADNNILTSKPYEKKNKNRTFHISSNFPVAN